MLGDNLPDPVDVITMYKQFNIGKSRLYKPDARVLNALRSSGIEVILGVASDDLAGILSVAEAAEVITYILAGNEVIPGDYVHFAACVIGNLQDMLFRDGITNIFVSTAVLFNVIGKSYPPSSGVFADEVRDDMVVVLETLERAHASLMIQVDPFFAYQGDPSEVRLDYAQFTAPGLMVTDGTLQYQNLLDAMLDSLYTSTERQGYPFTKLIVNESGWPTAGNSNFTSPELSLTYNPNFLDRIGAETGTPKMPEYPYEGSICSTNRQGSSRIGASSYPDKNTPVYPLFWILM